MWPQQREQSGQHQEIYQEEAVGDELKGEQALGVPLRLLRSTLSMGRSKEKSRCGITFLYNAKLSS